MSGRVHQGGDATPGTPMSPERKARLFEYLSAVLVAGNDPPEIDADTAAALAGLMIGARARLLMTATPGMTQAEAVDACAKWVREEAALAGQLSGRDGGRRGAPAPGRRAAGNAPGNGRDNGRERLN